MKTTATRTRKNLTASLIASCTPDKSFYIGEYSAYIRCVLYNIEKSLGRELTRKQMERVFEAI